VNCDTHTSTSDSQRKAPSRIILVAKFVGIVASPGLDALESEAGEGVAGMPGVY